MDSAEEYGYVGKEKFSRYFEAERLADNILGILCSSKYARDTPSGGPQVAEGIFAAVVRGLPLRMIGLWGGSKESAAGVADSADRTALAHLGNLAEEVNLTLRDRSRLEITLLFCDAHHLIANRRGMQDINTYYRSLQPMAKRYGFSVLRLLEVYDWVIENHQDIDEGVLHHIGVGEPRIIAGQLMRREVFAQQAREAAQRHSLWVRECGIPAEHIARVYAQMEIDFLTKLRQRSADAIFFSYSDPAIQRPIAEAAGVPMLYFHSFGKGHHECPWYVSGKPVAPTQDI